MRRARFGVIADLAKDTRTKPDLASLNAGSPVIDIYRRGQDDYLLKFVMIHSFPDMFYDARILKECRVKPEPK